MKRLVKKASGTVLTDSSPAGIERILNKELEEALGNFRTLVKIKPYLKIDEEDTDNSGNVTNAFGAVEISVQGSKLFIPFIVSDKTLLPFDTIRMGEQETSYDYSKLRKIVNGLDRHAKTKSEENGDNEFQTMEVADYDDFQFNNGFLGSIMNIRDYHKGRDMRGDTMWEGANFGAMDDERLLRKGASNNLIESFHEVMEKIAAVQTFTPEQLESYESHITKEAEKEEQEAFEKTAAAEDNLEALRARRDILKLSEETLVNGKRVASGNNIAFPTFIEDRLEYRAGRIYHQFESWFKNNAKIKSSKILSMVLDTKGGYRFLNESTPFMVSTKDPGRFEIGVTKTSSLEPNGLYTVETSESTLMNPFLVKGSFIHDRLNEGMIVSVRERAGDEVAERTGNSLFSNTFDCREMMPSTTKEKPTYYEEGFTIMCSKDPSITEPVFMTDQEVRAYISENGKDPQDINLANSMLFYTRDVVLIPQDYSFFSLKKKIQGFYTRPDGLFKEGPLSKEAAYEGQNKVTLVVKRDREPKEYAVNWKFAKGDAAAEGVQATKILKRSMDNLSRDQAQNILNQLGFDYRKQSNFFEIADRNGRSATFNLPDVSKAEQVAVKDVANSKVKEKMKNIANSMLHSKNFLPLMANNVADGLTVAITSASPKTADGAKAISDFFNAKEAMETALEMEKTATKINGSNWHEMSALMNMKYRLDKLAEAVEQGNYLYNTDPLFDKVATLKPIIADKTKELIDFNRHQLMKTSSYLVNPGLIKKALHQLDGLYVYASGSKKKVPDSNESLNKKAARFFNRGELTNLYRSNADDMSKNLQQLKERYAEAHAKLRAVLPGGEDSKIEAAKQAVDQAQKNLKQSTDEYESIVRNLGEERQKQSNQNLAMTGLIGIPGLAAASYGIEEAKDK